MMQPVLVDTRKSNEGKFRRRSGHSLKFGAVVAYELVGGGPFSIVVHRDGVEISGTFPLVGPEGIEVLRGVLARAIRHHTHLKSFPVGTKQEVLDEAILYNEELMNKTDSTKVDG